MLRRLLGPATSALGAIAVIAGLAGVVQGATTGSPLPLAKAETVGLSTERLRRVDAFIARMQEAREMPGAVTVVARRGKLVHLTAHGLADLESRRPIRTDDLFAIASMTKPIATVAVLMLLEEQRFLLSDPIDAYLPEFRDMKVATEKADAPGGYSLVPVERSITILDLLTHRSGLPFIVGNGPAGVLRQKAIKALPPDYTLQQYVAQVATQPLEGQPGSTFRYSDATTVLGRLIEVVSGKPLDVFLRERIFVPLAMTDTFFVVPPEKSARLVPLYRVTPERQLIREPSPPTAPRFFSAGGGLFSTAADYLRFCQMLLSGGALEERRILSRKSVELMTARHVETLPTPWLRGHAFGLGVALLKEDGESGLLGSPGTFGWSGAYNTYFRVDPREQLVMILLTQRLPGPPTGVALHHGFHNAVMQAIVD
jgi:CubicO group peptidase (beta-lactamase class C family)